MIEQPTCPACHQPVTDFEFGSATAMVTPVSGEAVIDLQLVCPHCRATLNMFPALTQFDVYP